MPRLRAAHLSQLASVRVCGLLFLMLLTLGERVELKERSDSHTIGPGYGIRTPRYTNSQNLRKPEEIRGEGLQETPSTVSCGDVLEPPLRLHRTAEQGGRMNILRLNFQSAPRITEAAPRACHNDLQSHSPVTAEERGPASGPISFSKPETKVWYREDQTKRKASLHVAQEKSGVPKGKGCVILGGDSGDDGVSISQDSARIQPTCMRSNQPRSTKAFHLVTLASQALYPAPRSKANHS